MRRTVLHRRLGFHRAALALLVLALTRDSAPNAGRLRHELPAPMPVSVQAPVAAPATQAAPATRTANAGALQPVHAADWSRWLQAANDGDPVAACRFALLLDDCRRAREVEAMVNTQLSMAAAGDTDATGAARDIAVLQASVDALHARCAVLPDVLLQHDADFLLRAALAGHAPSMLRYLVDPPLSAPSAPEREAALAAYRRHARLFLDALLQRTEPDALALAFRIAQGEEFVAGAPIRPRDPAAAARYGSALLALREDDAATLIGVETALSQLDAARARHAQHEGRQLATRFLSRQAQLMDAPAETSWDECTRGWPGREAPPAGSGF